ncbi:MAG: hypothetical protein HS126_22110 [Anaerolineales bacterium]|nr:hypothetical protein [Anaerolineales bacterium]
MSDAGPVNLARRAIESLHAAVENLTVDFKVKLTATGNEAGVIVPRTNAAAPAPTPFCLGIVAGRPARYTWRGDHLRRVALL